jgi:triosephosphate isomerase
MKKNNILIVGNWKMNPGTAEEAKQIFKEIKLFARNLKNIKLVICPPFVYLSDLEKTSEPKIILGAQDMFWEKSGAFTGEISPSMLSDESYVIIGHSERRELGESDEMVAKKVNSAIKAGLKPILCVGEKERDDHGEYWHFLRNQIINSLDKLPKKYLTKLVIAYEPVWAIGQAEAMKVEDIHITTIFIKKVLTEIFKDKAVLKIPILYGGSVSHLNASEIIKAGEVQGLLVGRESLNSKKFGELLKNVDQNQ